MKIHIFEVLEYRATTVFDRDIQILHFMDCIIPNTLDFQI